MWQKFKTRGAHYGCLWVFTPQRWSERVQVPIQTPPPSLFFYHNRECLCSLVRLTGLILERSPRTNSQIREILMIFFPDEMWLVEGKGPPSILPALPESIIKAETCKKGSTFPLFSLYLDAELLKDLDVLFYPRLFSDYPTPPPPPPPIL